MTKKQQILAEIERMLDDTSMYRNLDQRTGGSVALARLHTFLDTLPDEPVEKTCKTCRFYENDCPFTRGKFIPYPNIVCKDYTCSTLKAEQEPVSEDERIRKEIIEVLRFVPSSMWEQAKTNYERCFAYLEKQKENPKSAISIPADCASNAKCPYKIHGDDEFIGDIRDTPAYHFGFDEGVCSEKEKQKEQKPIKVVSIPKFRTGDLVRSSKNPRLTYKILGVGSMNELGNPEYEVEIFTDEEPDEPRNLKHIEIVKMDSWGEPVEQKPATWHGDDGLKPAEWSEEDEQ